MNLVSGLGLGFLGLQRKPMLDSDKENKLHHTSVTPRQPTRLTKTTAFQINRREYGVNTCLGTTCHGQNWYMASCSQTGIYSLLPLIDFSGVCCSLSRWLSRGIRCVHRVSVLAVLLVFCWRSGEFLLTKWTFSYSFCWNQKQSSTLFLRKYFHIITGDMISWYLGDVSLMDWKTNVNRS